MKNFAKNMTFPIIAVTPSRCHRPRLEAQIGVLGNGDSNRIYLSPCCHRTRSPFGDSGDSKVTAISWLLSPIDYA